MKTKIVLIIGSSHLAFRVKKQLVIEGYNVLHTNIELINSETDSISLIENLSIFFKDIDTASLAMVYLIEDKDENNLQLIISLISLFSNIPITASLFNENLTPHLLKDHINLKILNPAKIAAPSFVEQLNIQIAAEIENENLLLEYKANTPKSFSIIQKILMAFTLMLIFAVFFFHFYENLSWIDAIYFVTVTAASVGYGDINLANSNTISKIVGILLIFGSTISIWMIFSLTIDLYLKRSIQLELGRKKYTLKNHVIVCGLGRLGYFIVEELIQKNEKVIVVEQNENSNHINYFRQLGAEVYIGDARLPKVMQDVNVIDAKALISVINNDSLNLEIGLNARSHHNTVKLILRIYDDLMAEKIKDYLQIHHSISASAIASKQFLNTLNFLEA
ncbi:MAG: potassium channel family protein [Ferruginibacter sp.]|nr:potassium channel family protein [Ferruginibacter sp.]